jgi:sec-independent protein translocase protein TatA
MGPPELIIIGIVAIAVIFGAKRIPEIARNMGRSSSEFKRGMREGAEAAEESTPPSSSPSPPTPTPAPSPTEPTDPPSTQA